MTTPKDLFIFLVEDNADDEAMALRAIRRFDSQIVVTVFRDGREALDNILAANVALPALVLVDLKLPKVSGHEVIEGLRKDSRFDCIPVVAFTSSIESRDIERCYSL